MKKQFLIALAISLTFMGCGSVDAPKPSADVSKRASMIYQPDKFGRMEMLYPVNVGIMQLNDKRVLPFYAQGQFFQEDDMDGLNQMTYLELKKSGLFARVKNIPEKIPANIDDVFLQNMHKKYDVDMILILDVTSFNLFRSKNGRHMDTSIHFGTQNVENDGYAPGAFKIDITASMIGQLIYYDGGIVVWSGDVSRSKRIAVADGVVSSEQLSELAQGTLKPFYTELKKHIFTTAKRMGQQ
ncbi:MAG: hypothetical protein GQ474_03905 [Sulfurimonas sp.]|nr:hypothetical protein [Sulfurimonas sp.]